jgi:hypothetical protein
MEAHVTSTAKISGLATRWIWRVSKPILLAGTAVAGLAPVAAAYVRHVLRHDPSSAHGGSEAAERGLTEIADRIMRRAPRRRRVVQKFGDE